MKQKLSLLSVSVLALSVLLSGCVASRSQGPSTYAAGQAEREMTIRFAVVESVRDVTIEEEPTGAGTVAGGAVGAIAGSSLSSGTRASAVGGILGAVAGGIAGQAISKSQSKKSGVEITVKLENNGEYRAIVQEKDPSVSLQKGDRVRIMSSGNLVKVVKE
jgi:outer membrane lipoprotein SlyB